LGNECGLREKGGLFGPNEDRGKIRKKKAGGGREMWPGLWDLSCDVNKQTNGEEGHQTTRIIKSR